MNIALAYDNFIRLFRDYCNYDLTEDEWWTIYDYFSEATQSTTIAFDTIENCLKWHMDIFASLFGEFETWDEYMEKREER